MSKEEKKAVGVIESKIQEKMKAKLMENAKKADDAQKKAPVSGDDAAAADPAKAKANPTPPAAGKEPEKAKIKVEPKTTPEEAPKPKKLA